MTTMYGNIVKPQQWRRWASIIAATLASLAFYSLTLSATETKQSDAPLSDLKDAIQDGPYKEVHSLLISKNNDLIFEAYFEGNTDYIDFENGVKRVAGNGTKKWSEEAPHYVASVTKTVTALLTGIALDQMNVQVSTPIQTMLSPEHRKNLEGLANHVTLHHLLAMSAGFRWDEWTAQDLISLWQTHDFTNFVIERPNDGPGKFWTYNSALPNIVLTIVETGLDQPLYDWADTHFFRKLGIHNYQWDQQPTGTPEGSARLHLRPRDMIKIGELILNKGNRNGEQIISKSWIDRMTTEYFRPDHRGYGYYIWLTEQAGVRYFSAEGDGGQYINIFPDHGIVIVMTQGNYLEWPLYTEQARDIMEKHIFPALGIN